MTKRAAIYILAVIFSLASVISTFAAEPVNEFISGIVYNDLNRNSRRDADEKGILGVRVSNGIDIVKTDKNGRYQLPARSGGFIFVIKPSGWMTPVDTNNLPQFFQVFNIDDTWQRSVDFPLYKHKEPKRFDVIFMADPQVTSTEDVHYLAHDIIEELIGTNAAFGANLGDLVFDKIELFDELNCAVGRVGIPWYNIKGNHDGNRSDFESVYGPSYYSFDYGTVHFIVMDNSNWGGNKEHRDHQTEFIKNDLNSIPQDQLVVLMLHKSFMEFEGTGEILELLEVHPNSFVIGGHLHSQEHKFFTKSDGWNGLKPLHCFSCGAASGTWWTGAPDELGVPSAVMWDGTPNGYNIVTFDKNRYSIRYKVARRSADYQMNIWADEEIEASKTGNATVYANIFAGSERSKVEMQIDDGLWTEMKLSPGEDPYYCALKAAEKGPNPPNGKPLSGIRTCLHLWKSNLPKDLTPGIHVITVRTTDIFGQSYTGRRTFIAK